MSNWEESEQQHNRCGLTNCDADIWNSNIHLCGLSNCFIGFKKIRVNRPGYWHWDFIHVWIVQAITWAHGDHRSEENFWNKKARRYFPTLSFSSKHTYRPIRTNFASQIFHHLTSRTSPKLRLSPPTNSTLQAYW